MLNFIVVNPGALLMWFRYQI